MATSSSANATPLAAPIAKSPTKPKAATVKVVPAKVAPATQANVRTSHTECDHATIGREGKIARAKCRRDRTVKAAAASKAVVA